MSASNTAGDIDSTKLTSKYDNPNSKTKNKSHMYLDIAVQP